MYEIWQTIFPDREFGQGRENESFLGLSYGSTCGGSHLQIKICSYLRTKYTGENGEFHLKLNVVTLIR